MNTTVNKDVIAFLSSLLALLASVNVLVPDWAVAPGFAEIAGPILGSLIVGLLTWWVPNRPAR